MGCRASDARSVTMPTPGRMRTRLAGAIALGIAVMPFSAERVAAQWIVEDPWNLSYNVAQYVKQVYQVQMQVQQLEAQLQDMRHLEAFPTRNVAELLNEASALLGRPQTLGYANEGVGGAFAGYYTPSQVFPQWTSARDAQARAAVTVMQAALLATYQQQQALTPGEAAILQMGNANRELAGQQQALELQNSAALYSAEELMLLRQAAMLQTNLQAVYYADQIARDAQRDTTINMLLSGLMAQEPLPATVSLRLQP
jgi:P-type conjugative transfer protein TrbJ